MNIDFRSTYSMYSVWPHDYIPIELILTCKIYFILDNIRLECLGCAQSLMLPTDLPKGRNITNTVCLTGTYTVS